MPGHLSDRGERWVGLDERLPQHDVQQMRCIEMRAQQILEHGVVASRIIACYGMLPDLQPLAHITPQTGLRKTRPVVAQRNPQVKALGLQRVRQWKPLPPPLHPNLGNGLLHGPAHLIGCTPNGLGELTIRIAQPIQTTHIQISPIAPSITHRPSL